MYKNIETHIIDKVPNIIKGTLSNIISSSCKNLPKVSFISTDGDLLSFKSLMKIKLLDKNKFPLFAESTLKTWIITQQYNGEKEPILNDCYNLMDICDEICLILSDISNVESIRFSELAEGIQLELGYWVNNKLSPIFFSPIEERKVLRSNFIIINNDQIKNIIDSSLIKKKKKKTAFLLTNNIFYKHTDWMTQYALNNGYTPVSPWDLITKSEFHLCGKTKMDQILYFFSLARKCDDIFIFTPKKSFEDLDEISASIIYFLINIKPQIKIINKSFADIGIPKYTDIHKWAITNKEKNLLY